MERPERTQELETVEHVASSPAGSLQRADSMTLGSLMLSTPQKPPSKKVPKSSRSLGSPQTPKATLESPTDLTVQHRAAFYNDNDVRVPEIAPEIDDFDIFYQDLY